MQSFLSRPSAQFGQRSEFVINFLVHDIPPMLLAKVIHECETDNDIEVLCEMLNIILISYILTVIITVLGKQTIHPNFPSSFTYPHVISCLFLKAII